MYFAIKFIWSTHHNQWVISAFQILFTIGKPLPCARLQLWDQALAVFGSPKREEHRVWLQLFRNLLDEAESWSWSWSSSTYQILTLPKTVFDEQLPYLNYTTFATRIGITISFNCFSNVFVSRKCCGMLQLYTLIYKEILLIYLATMFFLRELSLHLVIHTDIAFTFMANGNFHA